MLSALLHLLVPDAGGGLSLRNILRTTRRDQYSDFLPYVSYDRETGVYCNQDDTIGFLWECLPLAFAGMKTVNILEGLFRAGLPENSVLQFILYADPSRSRHDPMVAGFAQGQAAFLKRATDASDKLANIPVRNFRLFVAAKMPMMATTIMISTSVKPALNFILNFIKNVVKVIQFPDNFFSEFFLVFCKYSVFCGIRFFSVEVVRKSVNVVSSIKRMAFPVSIIIGGTKQSYFNNNLQVTGF